MMSTDGLVTVEGLLTEPPEGPCELIAGKIAMLPYADFRHGAIAATIGARLGSHAEKERLGDVLSVAGFILARDPDTVRAPDIAFIPSGRPDSLDVFVPGPPDLAVEVISFADRITDVTAKAQTWLDAGAPLVWVVWPDTRNITVRRPGQPTRILHVSDTISGEEALPGFECPVGECFRD